MALGTPVDGGASYNSNGNPSLVSPSYPTGITSTDVLVLIVGQKPATANGGTVTTPTGWTLRAENGPTGGYGTTLGADTGNTWVRFYTKDTVTGSETGSLSVTLGSNNISWAAIVRIPTDSGNVTFSGFSGEQIATPTASLSVALTADSSTSVVTGDIFLTAMTTPTDVGASSQFALGQTTMSGLAITRGELEEPNSSTGNDIGGFIGYSVVASGSASGTSAIFSAGLSGTLTNVRGPVTSLLIHEIPLQALDGNITGTATSSGEITQSTPLDGSATVTADATADIGGDFEATYGPLVNDNLLNSGTLVKWSSQTNHSIAGTSSVTAAGSGALTLAKRLAGSAAVSASASAVTSVGKGLAGSATTSASTSAAASVVKALTGSASALATASGTVDAVAGFSGSVTATAQASGDATVLRPLEAQVNVAAVTTGALSASKPLDGSATTTASTSSAVSVVKTLVGSAAGLANASASIDTSKPLSGGLAITASASASAIADRKLVGSSSTTTTVAAPLFLTKPLIGSVSGTATTTGTAVRVANLASSITATAVATASVTTDKPLGGASTATATGSANVLLAKPITGSAQGAASASLSLSKRVNAIGSAAASSSATATLSNLKALFGSASASATAGPAFLDSRRALIGASTLTASANATVYVNKTLSGSATLLISVEVAELSRVITQAKANVADGTVFIGNLSVGYAQALFADTEVFADAELAGGADGVTVDDAMAIAIIGDSGEILAVAELVTTIGNQFFGAIVPKVA